MAAAGNPAFEGGDLPGKERLAYEQGHDSDVAPNEGVAENHEAETLANKTSPDAKKARFLQRFYPRATRRSRKRTHRRRAGTRRPRPQHSRLGWPRRPIQPRQLVPHPQMDQHRRPLRPDPPHALSLIHARPGCPRTDANLPTPTTRTSPPSSCPSTCSASLSGPWSWRR